MTAEEFKEFAKKGKTTSGSEHDLQVEMVKYFRMKYPQYKRRLMAIPNGGQRHIAVASKLKAEGVIAGCWDLLLSVPKGKYGGCWIETKFGKNGLTQSQIDFREANKDDYYFFVYYDFETFKNEIEKYLNGKV